MTDLLSTLAAFVLMISIVVTVHEFGHYAAGRAFGLVGTVFSIGFGRRLLGINRWGTDWRISPFLIGGYVRFPEENDDLRPGQKTLNALPRWQRAIVVAAGPAINFVLAAALFAVIAYSYGYPSGRPIVLAVTPGSPAAAAGLQPGDEIKAIGGFNVVLASDVTQLVMLMPGKPTSVSFMRDASRLEVTPRLGSRIYDDGMGNSAKIGFLGIEFPKAFERSPTIGAAITKGVSDGAFTTYAQLTSMGQIVKGDRSVKELSGPIRIAKMSAHTLSMGTLPFLYMMAMISIAVGVMNLLPIPTLDGGHLATYAVEGMLRRSISVPTAKRLLKVGLIIIIAMAVFAITLDILALS
ncbi:RIP metalloprotease [Sphingosinicella sp. BN140058]|uniref:M50 family metallopeptidase n=1 Tax=Sphingosinicella sp. BN140058 TaxID=1892855 RepID=UPI0013EB824B|nr:M50 family metallopeptidase [Sphingosinicella sp. BN140058]